MLQFSPRWPTTPALTTNVFGEDEVHHPGRGKPQVVVIRVRNSMERCRRGSRVVKRRNISSKE
jgi:hypothetical protein